MFFNIYFDIMRINKKMKHKQYNNLYNYYITNEIGWNIRT